MDAITRHKMTLSLPSDVEFRLSRAFDAPRTLVFRAFTEAKHLRQWYGCMSNLVKCDVDLSVNGGYRFTMGAVGAQPLGTVFGVYREIVIAERLVYTQGFVAAGFLSPNALVTTTFDEQDGHTVFASTVWHNSMADRDMHLKSGVEQGAATIFDQLEAHLRTMT
jgi:uncharacterized protein YndB with AHSA1/START domain